MQSTEKDTRDQCTRGQNSTSHCITSQDAGQCAQAAHNLIYMLAKPTIVGNAIGRKLHVQVARDAFLTVKTIHLFDVTKQ